MIENRPDWLPLPLDYNSYGGNWEKFVNDAYNIFLKDFYHNQTFYNKSPVDFDKTEHNGKYEGFWHITQGQDKEDVPPDELLRRTERISWPSPIIKNYNDPLVKIWQNKRGRIRKILFWLETIENLGYVVVMRIKKDGGYFLETSYPTHWKSTRKRFLDEYNEYLKSSKRRP